MSEELFEHIIYENYDKAIQYRLVLSEFREVQYIHIRKYYLDFEGEFQPSKEGASFPASVDTIYNLMYGLQKLLSDSENKELINTHFKDLLNGE